MKNQPNKSIEQQEINKIFNDQDIDNIGIKSFAGLLDSVIQNSLSGHYKFLFELLQNADDAEIKTNNSVPVLIEVDFIFHGNYLIIRHNGKQFDKTDVTKICSAASLEYPDKRVDSNKTGYKNIGFKSLFSISDYIAIFSENYHFRFDKSYFKNASTRPWQVMPIWTDKKNIPGEINHYIKDKLVNFVLRLNDGEDLQEEIDHILNNPHLMLFLRRVKQIRLIKDKKETLISHTAKPSIHPGISEHWLEIDKQIKSTWLISDFTFDIPSNIKQKLSQLDDVVCPQRLKDATQSKLQYAVRFDNKKLIAEKEGVLYATLPTGEKCGLPFLVNGEFLLNQDRTELLENSWNGFLLKKLSFKQFDLLKQLAEFQQTRDHVLTMLSAPTINVKSNSTNLKKEFEKGFKEGSETIAWIPAFDPEVKFLKLKECIVDATGFYNEFKNIDKELSKKLIAYQLDETPKLDKYIDAKYFIDFFKLLTCLKDYLIRNTVNEFNYKLLLFLKDKSKDNFDFQQKISQTKCIISQQKNIIEPSKAYLPPKENIRIPAIFSENLIHPEVIWNDKVLRTWLLKQLYVKETTRIQLIRSKIFEWIEKNSIPAQHHIEIVRFIFEAFVHNELTVNDYDKLSLLNLYTQNNAQRPAYKCYLSNTYQPQIEMEQHIPDKSFFVSSNYIEKNEDVAQWNKFFLKIQVKEKIEVHFINQYYCQQAIQEKDKLINNYLAYIKKEFQYPPCPLSSAHYLSNFIDIDFIDWIFFPGYAKHFWKLVQNKWVDIRVCLQFTLVTTKIHMPLQS